MDMMHDVPGLRDILGELTYPTQKWQITASAEIYGADVHTRRALYGLPARVYESEDDIRAALPPANGQGEAAHPA